MAQAVSTVASNDNLNVCQIERWTAGYHLQCRSQTVACTGQQHFSPPSIADTGRDGVANTRRGGHPTVRRARHRHLRARRGPGGGAQRRAGGATGPRKACTILLPANGVNRVDDAMTPFACKSLVHKPGCRQSERFSRALLARLQPTAAAAHHTSRPQCWARLAPDLLSRRPVVTRFQLY